MYKFLRLIDNKIVSGYNNDFVWEIDKWYQAKGKLSICNNGFHCNEKPLDALDYVAGEIIAEVQTDGESIIDSNKQRWRKMKIVKAYNWTKKDSVALAIFSAELVLDIFEKQYPGDLRPRNAIKAAKKVLKNDNEKNRSAARSAALAAGSAEGPAAWSAAWAAIWSAGSAWAAWSETWIAAGSAAKSAILDKINTWIINHIKELKIYKSNNVQQ